jgi:hypothetical protein
VSRPDRRGGRVRLLGALAVSVLCVPVGCGDDRADGESGATTTASTQLPGGAERLAGRWAHYDVVAYEGDGMKTLIISYGFTDLDVVDGELVATESFCFSEHRSDQPISVELSDEATQAIRPESTPVRLTERDGRLGFFRPETPTGIGVTLENPAQDPLPTDPSDPRISDDDGDGRPGVTATISAPGLSGELYLARREIFAYDVTEQPDGTLAGDVIDRSEQLVIGASDDAFVTDAQWTQHPERARSPILLVPVERSWDCERLRAERPDVFPPTPEVDW